MDLFDRIRTQCQAVADQAQAVRIDHTKLADYALGLQPGATTSDPAHRILGSVADTVAFVVTLDAVNFGSGWFPYVAKRPGMSGYFTFATGLRERFEINGPMPAAELAEIAPAECAAIFGQSDDRTQPAYELMAHFAEAWNQLGRHLLESFGGESVALVEAADHSAERLVEILRAMPYFEDVRRYRGLNVPFYKRAQIMAADLALSLNNEGPGRFHDLDRLTIFADNLVPHVLRLDGVLVLDPALEARINAGCLVLPGSEAEVELRAGAVHAVECMVATLADRGVNTTAMDFDELLWNRGQGQRYKSVPRHRTRTINY